MKDVIYRYHGEYLSDRVIEEIVRDLEQLKDQVEKVSKSSS